MKTDIIALNTCSYKKKYKMMIEQIKREVYDLTELDSDSWHGILKNAADGGFPRNSTFIGCKGSQPTTRGYPCGLWLLFHSMLARWDVVRLSVWLNVFLCVCVFVCVWYVCTVYTCAF